jgi:pimeloyl-ACP methyl ester carboxylesterase
VALGYGRACALTKTELWEPPFVLPADAVSDWVCGLYPDGDEWPFSRPEVTDYTHDGAKLATTECLVQRSRRGLAVGCPTSGWTRAAIVSTDEVIRQRDELKLPILMLAAEEDTAVSTAAQAEFCAAVPSCTRVPIPGAGHELLIEEDGIREAFLACFDAFAADPTNGRETCPEIIAKLPKRTD